ncbi:hypothetical protein M569_13577 [Genlisea aurea]|uniref:Uncharacterized protein n=1 Tax=Genlisea aurea TaxID=192259 RepID=S8C3I0_9LAMI|nr:hypothetical protein M569_13577 [Genlisea aurea]
MKRRCSIHQWLLAAISIILLAALVTASESALHREEEEALPYKLLLLSHHRMLLVRAPRVHHPRPRPPLANGDDGEIDPRYSIEKRLVPGGPNPLHN